MLERSTENKEVFFFLKLKIRKYYIKGRKVNIRSREHTMFWEDRGGSWLWAGWAITGDLKILPVLKLIKITKYLRSAQE